MTRFMRAWRAIAHEQRLAALASFGLFVSMFLPWYSKTNTFVERGVAKATQTSSNAFQAFSFVEAAVLLVSAGVLVMLFARAERRQFRLPGGDAIIVIIAGAWTAALIFYRLLDKPGLQGNQRITATVGVQWGIFIALLIALGLVYAGWRMRAVERPEPPTSTGRPRPQPPSRGESGPAEDRPPSGSASRPGDDPTALIGSRASRRADSPAVPARRNPAAARPRYPPPPQSGPRSPQEEQLSFEDSPPRGE